MRREDVVKSSRLAGQVERYHTWPTLRSQSNGEHTWQVLRIYWEIFGPPSPEVTTHILWHDAGELATGDPPYPTKARDPELKDKLDRMENSAIQSMGGSLPPHLSSEEKRKIKICDLLEMWEFGHHERMMGNQFATPIIDETERDILNKIKLTQYEGPVMRYVRRKKELL